MKKKLVLGLVFIIFVLVFSGLFVLKNLKDITANERMQEEQERILDRYDDILSSIGDAQTELYRLQAGYSWNMNSLVEDVLQIEGGFLRMKGQFGRYLGETLCSRCHSVREEAQAEEKSVDELLSDLAIYKQKINVLIALRDTDVPKLLERETARYGEEITDKVEKMRRGRLQMDKQLEAFQMQSFRNSSNSIILAVILSILFASAGVVVLIRSISAPLFKLVRAMRNVSAGKYGAKVDINSDDEIGFLARTFNSMTDNLEKMSQEKDRLMDELRDLNAGLEARVHRKREELQMTHERMMRTETLSAIGTFASGVAHELSTPVSTIMSYFQMARKKASGHEEITKNFDIIERELLRCRVILRGMLDFARTPETQKAPAQVNVILHDLLLLIGYQTEYKNVVIRQNLYESLPSVPAMQGQLKQVFMNIVVNALQSMPDGGSLDVSTFPAPDERNIIVEISDTGCGIPEDDMVRIFQPFYTRKKSGTGLGLSITYKIVKAHGGEIEVQSQEGKGTCFRVHLPTWESDLSPESRDVVPAEDFDPGKEPSRDAEKVK